MSLEEINKWLDNEYGVSYTRLEELHDFYFEKYCDLKQENQKYKGVIDKAIEYLEEPNRDSFDYSKAKLLDILKEVE